MRQSHASLDPKSRREISLFLLKWEALLIVVAVLFGIIKAVEHDIQVGLRTTFFIFLFLQPIFAWAVRDVIRVWFVTRIKSD